MAQPPPVETVFSLRAKYDTSTFDYCCSPGEINLDRYIKVPVVHERRRFTDIMDEEIDDERRKTIVDRYTAGFVRQGAATCSLDLPRRVANEVRSRPLSAAVLGSTAPTEDGVAPFLREKPSTCCVGAGKPVQLTVVVTGKPTPVVQWFR
ncbi:obscurin-like [Hyalella azteca]|uniref:Obscurin-like n=1 Tax=Hyalella azteca TaxID=294128 RepID=A0A8B7NI64_HYAAZ|nr:obscurin-like [Hyalella azteca]